MKSSTVAKLRQKTQDYLDVKPTSVDHLLVEDIHKILHQMQVQQIELEMQNNELHRQQAYFERELREYRSILNLAPIGYITCDPQGLIIETNNTMCDMLGLSKNQVVFKSISSFSTIKHKDTYHLFVKSLLEHSDKQECTLELTRSDGVTISAQIVSTREIDEDGSLSIRSVVINNSELALQKKEKIKRADELIIADEEKENRADELVLANIEKEKRANELIIADEEKENRADELVLANIEKEKRANELIIADEEKENRADELVLANIEKENRADELIIANIESKHKADELVIANIEKEKRADELIIANIELKHKADELIIANIELKHRAYFDILTKLPNRALLAERLSQAMLQCSRSKQSLAVAYLDLDGFKAVNDAYGHNVGDKLLVTLSHRMKGALREGDTLARIGGDEFIVVIANLDHVEDKKYVFNRLLKAAAEPVNIGDIVIQVSASIGVTIYPMDGVGADQLMRHADQAMYVAKQSGKNRYHVFDTAQDNAINTHIENIGDIQSAFERQEFVLHYQPKVNMRTGKVRGVEALIRWQHPKRGLIPPLEFLPEIEGHSISLELGEWVIDTALSQTRHWQSIGIDLPISVNVSAYQIQQANFAARLAILLSAYPEINPHNLELEILEISALSDISEVSATMADCLKFGVRFALDDFGTGYSSLTYLKSLPAYLIKIDQSFVRDMLEDVDDLAIIEGVVGLAKSFQREVIAEGVETITHGVALLRLGCELAQGFGIARPMPAASIPQWVSSYKTDDAWHNIDCQ